MNNNWHGDHNPILLWLMKHSDIVALVVSFATAAVVAVMVSGS